MGPGFGYLGSIQFQWEERQCGGSVVDVNVKSFFFFFFASNIKSYHWYILQEIQENIAKIK